MKKLLCGLIKLFAMLAVLGAMLYAAVLYWDKIMELACKLKGLIQGGVDDAVHWDDPEAEDYADWAD